MPLWAKIYWVVAIALFGVWVWRRISGRVGPSDPSTDPGASSSGSPSSQVDSASDPSQRVWPAPPPLDPTDDTFRIEPTEAPSAAEPPAADAEPAGRSTPPSEPGVNTAGIGATLPELLAGITLPHELVPLTQVGVSIDLATHVVVATQKAPYEVVVEGLTTELERLGYGVDRSSMTELLASGERGIVKVLVHPDGSTVTDAGLPRFPTAEEHTVVVELFAG